LLPHLLLVVLVGLEIELHRVSDRDDWDALLFQDLQSMSGKGPSLVDAVNLDTMTVLLVSTVDLLNHQQTQTYQLEVTCKPQFQADRT
jgi:hypothetical protein